MASTPLSEPFPGPRPFTREESAIFKGRVRECRDLADLIQAYQLVVFHSYSGSGKTSLVQAGLLPLLAAEGFSPSVTARVRGQVPAGIDPSQIRNIYTFNALASCFGTNFDAKAALQGSLDEVFLAQPDGAVRLLILDQFEELFTSHLERWTDRKPFVQQVSKLCQTNPELRVLIVIRDDYLAELDSFADLLPYSLRIRYRLNRLTEEAALKGIIEPLAISEYTFETGVANELVSNLRKIRIQSPAGTHEIAGEFVEPVHLQIVCQNLWKNRPRERCCFTKEDIQKFADVNQALRSFYDQAISAAAAGSRVSENRLRNWFSSELITPEGTRGLVNMGNRTTGGIRNEAVRILEHEHVIRADSRAGGRWYEITHDRFIDPIRDSNRHWQIRRRRHLAAVSLIALFVALTPLAVYFWHAHRVQVETNRRLVQAQTEERTAKGAQAAFQYEDARKHYETALRLYTGLGVRVSQADTEFALGSVSAGLLEWDAASRHFETAFHLHGEDSHWQAASDDLINEAECEDRASFYAASARSYENALSLYNSGRARHPLNKGSVLVYMGSDYVRLGDFQKAEKDLTEGRELIQARYTELKNESLGLDNADRERLLRWAILDRANADTGLGSLAILHGDYRRAIEIYSQIRDGALEAGENYTRAVAMGNLGYSYMQLNDYAKALSFTQQADEINQKGVPLPDIAVWTAANSSYACLRLGRTDESLAKVNFALQLAAQQKDRLWTGNSLWIRAMIYQAKHDAAGARNDATKALEIFRASGLKEMEARTLNAIGLAAIGQGNHAEGVDFLQKAVALNEAHGIQTIFAKEEREDFERFSRPAAGRR